MALYKNDDNDDNIIIIIITNIKMPVTANDTSSCNDFIFDVSKRVLTRLNTGRCAL